jgi:hypothetical protein
MPSNAAPIVQQIQGDFHALIAYVTGPEAQTQSAYTVELTLFRRLLAIGAALLRLFFVTIPAQRPPAPTAADGAVWSYYDQRSISYYSVFGKLRVARHYFTAPGHAGTCPLDAALSLPDHCYSDLLCDWASYGSTDAAYRENQAALERILGLTMSVQALETITATAAADVTAFYQQPPDPATPIPLGSILVVQADGKGVPMVQPPPETPPLRLRKGQKRTKKKEAIVTTLYTIAPYVRTAQDVVAALLHDERRADHPTRPAPVRKEARATLNGKAAACASLQQRAAQRDNRSVTARVALTDGAESLQQQMLVHFPAHTLILDIIHASEYLWETATALWGETSVWRTPWVRTKLEQVVTGQTAAVISALEREASDPTRTDGQRSALNRTIGYYQRKVAYMRYDTYLAQGWPIGTGVVEGACGHLVKDRMEQASLRWTQDGAQAVLDLRAVRLNGDWDAYWQFHRAQQHLRLYGTAPTAAIPEAQVLQMAA